MRLPSLHIRILLLILLVGAGLRFFALSYGLPRLYLEDEEFFVRPAITVAEGHANPGWFGAPAQPLIYVLGATFRVVNIFVNLAHGTHATVTQNYASDPTPFQTAGRVWPALAGTALIAAVYALAAFWNRRAGLFAAAITATSFYFVDQSHIIRPDILQSLFLLLTLLGLFRMLEHPDDRRWYVLSGIAFGLAIGMKYPSLFLLLPLAYVAFLLFRAKRFVLRRWLEATAATLLTLFLTGPFLFLDPGKVRLDLAWEGRAEHGAHGGLNAAQNLWWYVTHGIDWQLGTLLTLIGVGALVVIVTRTWRDRNHLSLQRQRFAVLTVALLTYLVCTVFLKLHWARWVIPVTTLLCALSGIGLVWLTERLRRRPLVLTLVMLALFIAPLLRLGRTLYGYAHPYTTEQARTWMLDNVAPTTVVAEPYSPDLPPSYTTIRVDNLTWNTIDEYRARGATHAIMNGKVAGVILREAESPDATANFRDAARKYDALVSASSLAYEVLPHPRYTAEELLASSDFSVLRTLSLSLLQGPFVRIYALPQ